jgi:hypothetical protein
MFQFTSTDIINDSERFLVVGKDSNGDITTTISSIDSDAEFQIRKGMKITAADVTAGRVEVFKRAASAAANEEGEVTVPTPAVGDIFRLKLYVGLSGSQNSYYANDFVFKGKPFYVEAKATTTTASDLAEEMAKNAKKYMLMVYENETVNVTNSGAKIVVKATDEYQRFKEITLQKWNETNQAWDDVATGSIPEGKEGKEGFGTYIHLMKDYRLPTAANTRWNRINLDETPIVGAQYNQYVLYLTKDRGIMGGDALGQLATSKTAHVFWVKSDVVSAFETALTGASLTITTVS